MMWLLFGYLFLFVFRPFEYWPILGTLHVERVYVVVMITMAITNRNKRYIPHSITRSLIFFFMVLLVASAFALYPSEAYDVTYEYMKLLVFYFVAIVCIRDEEDLKNFIIAYIVIMFMYVGKSAWEFFLHDRYMWRMGIKRMMGIDTTYGDPNYFAASIVYSLPLWWALFRQKIEHKIIKIILWIYPLLATVSIIYTGSRAGLLTLVLFVLCLVLQSSKKYLAIAAMFVVLSVAWAAMPESYKVRFGSTFLSESSETGQQAATASAQGRILGLKTGYATFLKHPLLGIGPGNFKYAITAGGDSQFGMSAHNLYGQVLGELGGLGFTAFFGFIWINFNTHRVNGKKIQRILDNEGIQLHEDSRKQLMFFKLVGTASMQTLLLLLFNGNFGHNLYRYNYLWLGVLAVLISYFINCREDELRSESWF